MKAGARDFGAVEDGAIAVGLRKAGLLSRETRTAVGDRAYGLLDEWLRVGRRRFAEFSRDVEWATAFLRGAGSAALLLDEPAALAAFADSKIADRLGRAFDDLDLNAAGVTTAGLPRPKRRWQRPRAGVDRPRQRRLRGRGMGRRRRRRLTPPRCLRSRR